MRFFDDEGNPRWGCIGLAVGAFLIAAPIGCGIYSTFSSVTTAPSRVINRTLQTTNIIQNYEWFFDTNAQFKTRLQQVRDQEAAMADETDKAERERLRIELNTIRYSCRDLANTYNANSEKQNRALFKSRGLPATLDQEECNAPTTSSH
jgi:hypothetical protein